MGKQEPKGISRRTFCKVVLGGAALAATTRVSPVFAAERPKIKVAWLPGTCGRLYAAQAFNLFDKVGLDAQLVRFNTGPAMNAAFQSKSVDIGYSGLPGLLVALAAGLKMKLFLDENEADHAEGLVVRKGSGIKSVKDLKGHTVGTVIGTTAWMGLVTALKKSGVPDHEVTIKNLPLNTVVPSFERGEVDAVWIWAPWLFDLQHAGGNLISLDSDWLLNGNAWFGRTEYLEHNRKAVELFLAALDEGTQKIKTDPHAVAKFMSTEMGIPVEATSKLLKDVSFPSYAQEMNPNFKLTINNPHGGMAALLQEYTDVYYKHGIINRKPSLKGAVDPSFLAAYMKMKKSA